MANYAKTNKPLQGSRGVSRLMREEFSLIEEAIESKADLDSPAFEGSPTAPTPPLSANDDRLATIRFVNEKFVGSVISNIRVYRTIHNSSYTLVPGDKGNIIEYTGSAAITYSFNAASVLGDGWYVYIKNNGSGDITINPNGSETIDGLVTFVMYPGEARLIQCNSLLFKSIVLEAFKKIFIASGNFIKPPGYKFFSGFIWSAGGGGRSGGGGGGGGGGCFQFQLDETDIEPIETVIVGAGGSVNAYGGDSEFAEIKVSGGSSGASSGSDGGSGGAIRIDSGFLTVNNETDFGEFAGGRYSSIQRARHSLFGGGAGENNTAPGPPGSSLYGGGGGARSSSTGGNSTFAGDGGNPGHPGQVPAGGGGASAVGARGEVRIWGVI